MPPKTRKTRPERSQDVNVTQGENSHPIDHEVHHEDTNPPPPTVMFVMIKALQVSQLEVVGTIKELKDEKNSRNHRKLPEGEVELNKKDNTVNKPTGGDETPQYVTFSEVAALLEKEKVPAGTRRLQDDLHILRDCSINPTQTNMRFQPSLNTMGAKETPLSTSINS
jgi:hypothetical protein